MAIYINFYRFLGYLVYDHFIRPRNEYIVDDNDPLVVAGKAGAKSSNLGVNDQKTWNFDASHTNESGQYFTQITGDINGYIGQASCVIFRPNPTEISYAAGDVFTVTISSPSTLIANYSVTFFDINSITQDQISVVKNLDPQPNYVPVSDGSNAFVCCLSLSAICFQGTADQWIAVSKSETLFSGFTVYLNQTLPYRPAYPDLSFVSYEVLNKNDASAITLELSFDYQVSTSLNWSNGSFYIKDYYTDDVLLEIDDKVYYDIYANVSGTKITMPLSSVPHIESGKFYLTVDAGVIRSAAYTIFHGFTKEDEISFATSAPI